MNIMRNWLVEKIFPRNAYLSLLHCQRIKNWSPLKNGIGLGKKSLKKYINLVYELYSEENNNIINY